MRELRVLMGLQVRDEEQYSTLAWLLSPLVLLLLTFDRTVNAGVE